MCIVAIEWLHVTSQVQLKCLAAFMQPGARKIVYFVVLLL